jgi:uncharacterized protein (TIGR03437 family)
MSIRSLALFLCSGLAFAASSPSYPVLTYSTYLRDSFTPNAIATDSSGNIYMAGSVVVETATQTTALVVKLNPQATQYLYVRYLGGSVFDQASAIAVDSAGNAYVAGYAYSPDFPVTTGGSLGTPPTPATSPGQRSFVTKFDPNGVIVFSDLLGGSAASEAQAVAVNAAGQILVTGTTLSSGFPSTTGAYSVSNSPPYLLELDPTGTTMVFSATGIGGSAIALDSSGNIYVAGTTSLLNYPTTPGTYQSTFPALVKCTGPACASLTQGPNQYVSKVDPTGSKLIYSTSVSGTGQTTNAGLAVDAAGDVYLTGFVGAAYPYTVTAPTLPSSSSATPASPFLSKLDPAGQTLLFSVPVGGAGVQLDASGAVYVGGSVGFTQQAAYAISTNLPVLAAVPTQCLPNVSPQAIGAIRLVQNAAYTAQVDGTSGNVLGSQFIGGSALSVFGVAISSSTTTGATLWVAGDTLPPAVPFTPNALTPQTLAQPIVTYGAYLGAVNFSQPQPPAGTPQIACIVDAADLAPVGLVAPNQLLTIFGSGLGPATGVSASDNSTTTLGGVNISFPGAPAQPVNAPLLYASSTQINFAMPASPSIGPSVAKGFSTVMQLTVNGLNATALQFPLTYPNPSLFLNVPATFPATGTSPGPIVVALNADGSLNSATNPSQPSSTVSVFVNGLSNPLSSGPPQLYTNGGWLVTNVTQATPFVLSVDLQVPGTSIPPSGPAFCSGFSLTSVCAMSFTLFDVEGGAVAPQSGSLGGQALGGMVYVSETQ